MVKLIDIITSYSDKSSDEQIELIRKIRAQRMVEKPSSSNRAKKIEKPKKQGELLALKRLGVDELKKLIEEMENE